MTQIPWRASGTGTSVSPTAPLSPSAILPGSTTSTTDTTANSSELRQTLDPSLIVAEQESLNQLMLTSGLIYQVSQ